MATDILTDIQPRSHRPAFRMLAILLGIVILAGIAGWYWSAHRAPRVYTTTFPPLSAQDLEQLGVVGGPVVRRFILGTAPVLVSVDGPTKNTVFPNYYTVKVQYHTQSTAQEVITQLTTYLGNVSWTLTPKLQALGIAPSAPYVSYHRGTDYISATASADNSATLVTVWYITPHADEFVTPTPGP